MNRDFAAARRRERARILHENRRREAEIDPVTYAAWNPAEQFIVHGRRRLAASLLRAARAFPQTATRCLEVGFGSSGWLTDLLGWGVAEENLFGVEIDLRRAAAVKRRLPSVPLTVADGARLPWPDGRFSLVVTSTVFSSILGEDLRQRLAAETERVLAPGGALLWYDFKVDNPRNRNVRRIARHELLGLFPELRGPLRSVTLAPPLVRLLVPRSWWLAELLETLPFLRTHLLGVLVKPAGGAGSPWGEPSHRRGNG
ncbi:MAG: class I SAM-dependent methyltransferase [bacterium]|nr:class I SAM-dependent methyltransferase [bacterium]